MGGRPARARRRRFGGAAPLDVVVGRRPRPAPVRLLRHVDLPGRRLARRPRPAHVRRLLLHRRSRAPLPLRRADPAARVQQVGGARLPAGHAGRGARLVLCDGAARLLAPGGRALRRRRGRGLRPEPRPPLVRPHRLRAAPRRLGGRRRLRSLRPAAPLVVGRRRGRHRRPGLPGQDQRRTGGRGHAPAGARPTRCPPPSLASRGVVRAERPRGAGDPDPHPRLPGRVPPTELHRLRHVGPSGAVWPNGRGAHGAAVHLARAGHGGAGLGRGTPLEQTLPAHAPDGGGGLRDRRVLALGGVVARRGRRVPGGRVGDPARPCPRRPGAWPPASWPC